MAYVRYCEAVWQRGNVRELSAAKELLPRVNTCMLRTHSLDCCELSIFAMQAKHRTFVNRQHALRSVNCDNGVREIKSAKALLKGVEYEVVGNGDGGSNLLVG